MEINLLNLIDFEEVNKLLEGFNQSTGFVTAILDLEGNVLSKSGWRQICTQFHRVHPETAKKCTISDTVLAGELSKGEKYHFYECLNGLVDIAVPLLINGEHIANLFSGQFFFTAPDRNFFKIQAGNYGFNEQEYLSALDNVPVVSKEKVKVAMDFLLNMTQLISEMTYQKLEQVQLNEALMRSEERSHHILDHMFEGCQIIGFDWKYLYVNRSAEIHNKRPKEELIGQLHMDVWPGIEETEVYKMIKQTLEERTSSHFEFQYIFPDGSKGWFDLSIQPATEGVFIFSIDISERKRKEILLFESEFRFSNLYENGSFGMVLADKEFRFKKANPAFCAILGYSETELQQFTFKDVSHPDDLVSDLPNIGKLMNKEISVYKTEKRYFRKDGQMIWGSLTVTATYDNDGQFLYNLGIIEDITRRKLAEEALQETTIRLNMALNSSNSGAWDWDIPTNSIVWSSQMYELFGVDRLSVNASFDTWRVALHPEDKELAELKIEEALKKHSNLLNDYRVVLPDGNIRWISATGEGYYAENGQPLRMVGICQDITERKLTEENIRKKDTEFRKLSANVPDLIYQFTRKPDGSYCVPIASEGIWNIFGCHPEDVVDDFGPIGRVIYPEDAERVIRDIEYSAEHLTYFTCEFRVLIPGREIQWIYSNSTPERLSDGSTTWYGFNVDITQKKLAEVALKVSEEKFRKIFLTNVDAITITRLEDGRFVTANNGFKQIFEYSEDEIVGKTTLEIKMWIDAEDRKKFVSELQTKGTVENFETKLGTKSGKIIDGLISAAFIEMEGVTHILSTTKDITKRKLTEEALQYNEALLREVGRIAHVGGWDFDPATGKSSWTDQVALIHDLDPETPASVALSLTYYSEQSRPIIEKAFREAVEQAKSYDLELDIITAKGNRKWIRTIGHPIVEDGRVVKLQGSMQDITERKKAEEEVIKLNETLEWRIEDRTARLKEANQELEAFSYSV